MTTGRSTRASSRAIAGLALAAACLAAATPSAHRLDEYLQAARIDVQADRIAVELEMTPGVLVADDVIAGIDTNHDGRLSPSERSAYADRVLGDLALQVDQRPVRVRLDASSFPELDALRAGTGTIRIQSGADVPRWSPGAHRVLFRNSHRPDIGVYLANPLVPATSRIRINAERRDVDQRELTVDFTASR